MPSPNLNLPYVVNGQVGGEVVLADALNRIDGLIGLAVLGFDTNTPPGSPNDGEAWKIGPSPTGAWAGKADQIAIFVGGWLFTPAKDGLFLFDDSAGVVRLCTNAGADTWVVYGSQGSAVASLTDSTTGTPGSTLSQVSGSGADPTINNNFASLNAKLDALLAALRASSVIAT